jgi:hypothetical protein
VIRSVPRVLLALAIASPPTLDAQWTAGAAVGQSAPAASPVADPGLTALLNLGAALTPHLRADVLAGLPFESERGVIWISGGAALDRSFGGARGPRPRLQLSGNGWGYRDGLSQTEGGGLHGEVMPGLTLGTARFRVAVSAGSQVVAERTEASYTRWIPTLGGSVSGGGERLWLEGGADALHADGIVFPRVRALAHAALPAMNVWAGFTRWLSPELSESGLQAGISIRVTGEGRLTAHMAHHPNEPVFWNGPRRTWAVGVSHTFGPTPVRSLATTTRVHRSGTIRLSLPVATAPEGVSVAGDFSGWQPVAMERRGDAWVVSLVVGPGVHRYSFHRANGEWFVPEGTPGRRPDGFGGHVATLVVEGR